MAGLRCYPCCNSGPRKSDFSVLGSGKSGGFQISGGPLERREQFGDHIFSNYRLDKPVPVPKPPGRFAPNFGWTKNISLTQTGLPLQRGLHHQIAEPSSLANQSRSGWVDSSLRNLGILLQSGLGGVSMFFPSRLGVPRDEVQSLCEEGQLDKAVDVLFHMVQQGIVPSEKTYGSLLKLCTKRKSLPQVRRVHAHLLRNRLDSSRFIGEYLVSTLVKCGGLEDAVQAFHMLSDRTSFSWTAIISGYATAGQGEEALGMYRYMQDEGYKPDKYTFISLLKACGRMSDLKQGKRIHAEAIKYRCESDLFVGTCLVDMYAKCGSLVDAQIVFDGLSSRDLVSWNAMLAACALQGQAERALQLYEQMLEEGMIPDDRSFVSALQACAMLGEKQQGISVDGEWTKVSSLQTGKAIHLEAWRRGYRSDVFIGSALVSMYTKCGRILDAQIVFDGLSQRDVVSWTAMLSAHVQRDEGKDALELYEEMQVEGICPDSWIFVNAVQACSMLGERKDAVLLDGQSIEVKSLKIGKAIHAQAWIRGFFSNGVIGNALISMYGECGSILDAVMVFDSLVERNVVSWTALLSVYLQQGQAKQAIELFGRMLEEGSSPNDWTYVGALQACGVLADKEEDVVACAQAIKAKSLENGKTIHFEAWNNGFASGVFLGSALVSMYGKCGSIVDAQSVFDGLLQRNVVSWNAMLAASVFQGKAEKTMDLYEEMSQEGVSPDSWTFVSTLQACAILADKEEGVILDGQVRKVQALQKGKTVHADIQTKGFSSDVFVGNTLISMYGKSGSMVDGQNVFDSLPQRDVVSWNVILAAYTELGRADKALHLYQQMQEQFMNPNDTTIVHVLQACGSTGALDACISIHNSLISTKNDLSPLVASTLIHVYGKLGRMQDAQNVFDALPQPDVVSWTALLAGYAREGSYDASLQCYEKMQLQGVKPNGVTILSLLSACSHAGMVEKGIEYFESMSRCHGIAPQIEHYVTMVDILGRAGCFRVMEDILSGMPVRPNLTLWLCLLSACRKHGNIKLGRHAFNRAVQLQPNDAAAYILMSNIYTYSGMWDAANEVNALEQRSCGWKKPGQCWIEYDRKMHPFMVGDHKHLQQEQVHKLLEKVSLEVW